MKWHSRLERAVGGLIARWTLQKPLFEQRVPAWDRTRQRRTGEEYIERAIVDIEYTDTDNSRRWIDVSVRHPAAGTDADRARAARKPGEAARRADRTKHETYPGEQLTAFAVELPGRLGAEAKAWLKQQVRRLPADTQTHELNRAYKAVRCSVQSWMARQLRAASGLK